MFRKLLWLGSINARVLDNVVFIPQVVSLPKGKYSVTQRQNDGYRYVSFQLKPRISLISLFTDFKSGKKQSNGLEVIVDNNKFSLPQNLLDYLGILQVDNAILLPSLDYTFTLWEPNELYRYATAPAGYELEIFDRSSLGVSLFI